VWAGPGGASAMVGASSLGADGAEALAVAVADVGV
jgi:hypothetical protein